jgi:hypothetical protein
MSSGKKWRKIVATRARQWQSAGIGLIAVSLTLSITLQVIAAQTPTPLPSLTKVPVSTTPNAISTFAPSLDSMEPNNSPDDVLAQNPPRSFVVPGIGASNMNFAGSGVANDVDWLFMYLKGGATYQLTTFVQPGVDTDVTIYRDMPNVYAPIAQNDDYRPLDRGSQVTFTASSDGRYWVRITNKDASPRANGQTYAIGLSEVSLNSPTPQILSTPLINNTATPTPKTIDLNKSDKYEYNGDIRSASAIKIEKIYSNLNFAPYNPSGLNVVDNDFYKMTVARGSIFSCQTFDLGGDADTVMVVYDQALNEMGRNDDISLDERKKGNLGSRVTWQAKDDGVAYIFVYDASPLPSDQAYIHTYSLMCYVGITPPPDIFRPTDLLAVTPPPPPTKPPLIATSAPAPTVQALGTPILPAPPVTGVTHQYQNSMVVLPVRVILRPTSAPPTTFPNMRLVAIQLSVASDKNGNSMPDTGEGVSGVSTRILDDRTGEVIDIVLTDVNGNAKVVVMNDGPIRVVLPLLNYVQIVRGDSANIQTLVQTHFILPTALP